MHRDGKEHLGGAVFVAAVVAALVCGIGLFLMGLDGNLSATHFIRLGVSTLGAAMIGAVAGVFIVAAGQNKREEKKGAEPPAPVQGSET